MGEPVRVKAWQLKLVMGGGEAVALEAVYGRRLAGEIRREREHRWRERAVWWRREHLSPSYAMLCRYFAERRAWLLGTVALRSRYYRTNRADTDWRISPAGRYVLLCNAGGWRV